MGKDRGSYTFMAYLLALMWIGFAITVFYPQLLNFGIYPRERWGLIGILTSPFIHGSWQHLIANSTGMLIFGTIFCWIVKGATKQVVFYIIVVLGLLTWIFAREGNHIGASGLVFGIFGYLVSIGLFERKIKYILVSSMVMIIWGGTLVGILPTSRFISWEAHLFGFIAGISAAKIGLR